MTTSVNYLRSPAQAGVQPPINNPRGSAGALPRASFVLSWAPACAGERSRWSRKGA
jgi:hypothetical protein